MLLDCCCRAKRGQHVHRQPGFMFGLLMLADALLCSDAMLWDILGPDSSRHGICKIAPLLLGRPVTM